MYLQGMAKPPSGKTVGTRRAGHAKRGASRSMQQGGGPVHAKPRSLTCTDFEYVFIIPTSANILPYLWFCYHPLFLRLRIIVQLYTSMCNNKGCHRRLFYCMDMPIPATCSHVHVTDLTELELVMYITE